MFLLSSTSRRLTLYLWRWPGKAWPIPSRLDWQPGIGTRRCRIALRPIQSGNLQGKHATSLGYITLMYPHACTLYPMRPSVWPSGIGSRLGRNKLWVRFLAVSDTYPMCIEPTITWVLSGFSGYIYGLGHNCMHNISPCMHNIGFCRSAWIHTHTHTHHLSYCLVFW